MELEEETKPTQSAIQYLTYEERMTLAQTLKRAVENTNNVEEKRYYKTRIRELFTEEEWKNLIQQKNQKENH